MKRPITLLTLTLLITVLAAVSLTACREVTEVAEPPANREELNSLMAGASPETSVLALYTFGGGVVQRSYITGEEAIRTILDSLNAVSATEALDWSISEVNLPIYGLEIGGDDGFSIQAAWSNGYWIAEDGAAYRFDFDFSALVDSYDWTGRMDFDSFSAFPNARTLTQDDSGWNTKLLTVADTLTPPRNITMTLDALADRMATVTFTNLGGDDFYYGEYFTVQALIGDNWYDIPAAQVDVGFPDIAHVLRGGDAQSQNYHVGIYGDLPNGTYRLVAYEMHVEFTVP